MPQPIKLGIRAKLVSLFLLIKVVPLILLALLAWQGVLYLGERVASEADLLNREVQSTVSDMGNTFSLSAEKALNDRAREEIERLSTDTARSIAEFLYARDQDLLLAAQLPLDAQQFKQFLNHRTRKLVDSGEWTLSEDQSRWQQVDADDFVSQSVTSTNPENRQDFHYRVPESVLPSQDVPLYHEITFVDLNGQEQIKVQSSDLLSPSLNNISDPANTWSKAEHYFSHLKRLKVGEIYVSDVIGPYVPSRILGPMTPARAAQKNIPFTPEEEAYAGKENPVGKKFKGIVRWATPVAREGQVIGYLTLALNHDHIMAFTNNIHPSSARYQSIADAAEGNYAFIWDYKDRSIAHPRHHSIVGFDPETGARATPWLEAGLYEDWQKSQLPLERFLETVPAFDQQTRSKKPSKVLTQQGFLGLDCRYLNFAPQCKGWYDLTQYGGSGSFLILWTGVWKLTTAATIPYYTGQYGDSPRGFGFVAIGANIDDFQLPAKATAEMMESRAKDFSDHLQARQSDLLTVIDQIMADIAVNLSVSTLVMVAIVVIIAIWMASLLTEMVKQFSQGLSKIESGDYGFRFKHRRQDELGELSDALNRMADGVQASFALSDQARQSAEEASRMKNDFLARMSHELRTPLNGVLGFAEVIKMDPSDQEEVKDYASVIVSSGQHLLHLVDDMLDMAKMDAGQLTLLPGELKLCPWLRDLGQVYRHNAEKKQLDWQMQIQLDETFSCYLDAVRLKQVLSNLLDNALKFTAQGHVMLSVSQQDGQLYFDIQDTGIGVPEAAFESIFEAFRQGSDFVTRHHGGTGLGLAIARELSELMGGQLILVASVEQQGSHFRLSLPIAHDPDLTLLS